MSKFFKPKDRYAVFEKEPQQGPIPNGVVMGSYLSREEAEKVKIRFGFISDNFYVGKLNQEPNRGETTI